MRMPGHVLLFCAAAAMPAQVREPEVFSALGKAYSAKPDPGSDIEKADLALAKAPHSADLLLAAARARDSLLRFRDSIPLYTRGIDEFPGDVRFLRYRGHRFISTRRLDFAVADLKKAAEIAPASFDVAYHLGLAYYLRGDFNHAAREYQRCLSLAALPKPEFLKGIPEGWRSCYSLDDDSRVALTEWAWRACRRAGKTEEAARMLASIKEDMSVRENQSYFKTLLLYKGLRTESQVLAPPLDGNALPTLAYGIGLWHWLEGRRDRACEMWSRAVADPNWSAFGLIAAEAELSRGVCSKRK